MITQGLRDRNRVLDQMKFIENSVRKETTKTSIQHAESKYGVRYSVLLALPYFDPIKFTVIDPMHNLFLGMFSRFGLNWST